MKISIRTLATLLVAIIIASCSNNESKQESEKAFRDYKDFVTQLEFDAEREYSEAELRAMHQADENDSAWETETAEASRQYDDYKRKVVENLELYNDAEQKEFQELENRYNEAFQKKKSSLEEVSRRYKLREALLGLEVKANDFSNIGAAELPATYERFVQNLDTRATDLKGRDWELVEGWWVALNNRKRTFEDKLSAAEEKTISEATKRYQEIRKK
jgi:hypothetical protein